MGPVRAQELPHLTPYLLCPIFLSRTRQTHTINKAEYVYSLAYNEIPNVFFTPHHVNIIAVLWYQVILHNWDPWIPLLHNRGFQQWEVLGRKKQSQNFNTFPEVHSLTFVYINSVVIFTYYVCHEQLWHRLKVWSILSFLGLPNIYILLITINLKIVILIKI